MKLLFCRNRIRANNTLNARCVYDNIIMSITGCVGSGHCNSRQEIIITRRSLSVPSTFELEGAKANPNGQVITIGKSKDALVPGPQWLVLEELEKSLLLKRFFFFFYILTDWFILFYLLIVTVIDK